MLLMLALFFKCGCLFLQLRQSRVKNKKKKKNYCPRVHWDKCTSMNMIDFSQEDDDEIQIGIEHTKTM